MCLNAHGSLGVLHICVCILECVCILWMYTGILVDFGHLGTLNSAFMDSYFNIVVVREYTLSDFSFLKSTETCLWQDVWYVSENCPEC